jgi:hypothetical protein
MLCQYQVAAAASSGDSGSPVYQPDAWNAFVIRPLGILWAGQLSGGGAQAAFVYSPVDGIESDLGTLRFETTCSFFCFGTYY